MQSGCIELTDEDLVHIVKENESTVVAILFKIAVERWSEARVAAVVAETVVQKLYSEVHYLETLLSQKRAADAKKVEQGGPKE